MVITVDSLSTKNGIEALYRKMYDNVKFLGEVLACNSRERESSVV
ncbi:hypothetical protein SDC9_57818 [bioreactor metagenome]|uniref:Uncharacterized protein n=1 Tax=bioreactor metagenome TaxID=1076179 RepID=A0A644X5Q1_9ZZZZ